MARAMYTEANHTVGIWLTINDNETTTVTVFNDFHKDTLLDETTHFILQLIFYIILSCAFGILGTITNILNIIIFIKQGLFSGGSVLVLFFLSVADLGVSFTNVLHSICFAIIAADIPDLSFDPFAIAYLFLGWPHATFTIVNRILTAYVAFERCLCVVVPFRVKRIFTPNRSLAYILSVFAYSFLSLIPFYWTHRLGFEQQSGTNASKLVLTFGANNDFWHDVVYYSNFFVISFFCVIVVVISTVITSTKVRTSKEWRKSIIANTNTTTHISKTNANVSVATISNPHSASRADTMSTPQTSNPDIGGNTDTEKKLATRSKLDKETRLVKMITTISIIFFICYIPEFTITMLQMVDDRMRVNGQYHRLAHLMYSIIFVFATVNSSINIFVYYSMSTNYRKEFLSYFRRNQS